MLRLIFILSLIVEIVFILILFVTFRILVFLFEYVFALRWLVNALNLIVKLFLFLQIPHFVLISFVLEVFDTI